MIDTRGNLIEMSKEMQLFNASLGFDHQQLRYRGTYLFFFGKKGFFRHDKTSINLFFFYTAFKFSEIVDTRYQKKNYIRILLVLLYYI